MKNREYMKQKQSEKRLYVRPQVETVLLENILFLDNSREIDGQHKPIEKDDDLDVWHDEEDGAGN